MSATKKNTLRDLEFRFGHYHQFKEESLKKAEESQKHLSTELRRCKAVLRNLASLLGYLAQPGSRLDHELLAGTAELLDGLAKSASAALQKAEF